MKISLPPEIAEDIAEHVEYADWNYVIDITLEVEDGVVVDWDLVTSD